MENSDSTTAWWWWSSWYFCRASPSTTEEEKSWRREGLRQKQGCGCPISPSLYIGGREEEEAP